MNYQETLDYLYAALPMYQRVGKTAYKANLENAHELDRYLKYPHRKFKSIHVGGTNGKGSTSHMLAAILQAAGYKVGLYTSPHLLDFRERIRVNGQVVSEEFVVHFTETHRSKFEDLKPSFFEMTVFMAFEYFAFQQVDYAIIEVGLGGRLDATNVITPMLSVITNIGYDHMQFLGDNLEAISGEKAGIIKPAVPVVIGEKQDSTRTVFGSTAQEQGSPIWFADDYYEMDFAMQDSNMNTTWHFKKNEYWSFSTLTTDLKGAYQKKNLATVLMCCRVLKQLSCTKLNEQFLTVGLKQVASSTGILGRWQVCNTNPLTVCDIAHNQEGLTEIMSQIRATAHKKLHMVLGFVDDKNIDAVIALLPDEASYYLCQPNIPRALPVEELEKYFCRSKKTFKSYKSVSEAALNAGNEAGSSDLIYIGGSTFVVADYLASKKK